MKFLPEAPFAELDNSKMGDLEEAWKSYLAYVMTVKDSLTSLPGMLENVKGIIKEGKSIDIFNRTDVPDKTKEGIKSGGLGLKAK